MRRYIDADYEEPNCMTCMNQDICEGKNCGPEYAWQRYCRYEEVINVCGGNLDIHGESFGVNDLFCLADKLGVVKEYDE